MSDPAELLSEATRLSILQGRFEALHLGAPRVEPHHLLLGLLKTMDPMDLERAGLDAEACAALISRFGADPAPAPLSPADIEYAEQCHLRIQSAIEAAPGELVTPSHLLDALRDDKMTR